jgi:hypothetical protein
LPPEPKGKLKLTSSAKVIKIIRCVQNRINFKINELTFVQEVMMSQLVRLFSDAEVDCPKRTKK